MTLVRFSILWMVALDVARKSLPPYCETGSLADLRDTDTLLYDHVGPAPPSPHDPTVVVIAAPLHILGTYIPKLALRSVVSAHNLSVRNVSDEQIYLTHTMLSYFVCHRWSSCSIAVAGALFCKLGSGNQLIYESAGTTMGLYIGEARYLWYLFHTSLNSNI